MEKIVVKSSDKVQYELRRSKRRKHLSLTVSDTGNVVVKAPYRLSKASIDTFVTQHVTWIAKQQALRKRLPPSLDPHTYEDQDEFFFLGKKLVLTIQGLHSGKTFCVLSGQNLLVYRHPRATQIAVKRAVEHWYRDEGLRVLHTLVSQWCTQLGISSVPNLEIRDYRRRWGSCSQTGTISFALRCLMLDVELLDYLALHEVAHLVHFNHGSAFHSVLNQHMPDWRKRKQEMTRLRLMASHL